MVLFFRGILINNHIFHHKADKRGVNLPPAISNREQRQHAKNTGFRGRRLQFSDVDW